MIIRNASLSDKSVVLELLDDFRADCIEQITGKPGVSNSARTGGANIFKTLLTRSDYCVLLLIDSNSNAIGIITGYLCPMLRNGEVRAEVEEFFNKKEYRGQNHAKELMNAFFSWCESMKVKKVNLESDNDLHQAHNFYQKYGFEIKAQRFVKKIGN
jgi:GNAT superfamily N-acetyltransferase